MTVEERLEAALALLARAKAVADQRWFSGDYGDHNDDEMIELSGALHRFLEPVALTPHPEPPSR